MLPVLFKISTFEVHSYGVMMMVAFIAAFAIAQSRAARYGMTKSQVGDLCFWCVLAGVLGARIVFIVQEWDWFKANPSELYSIQFRGLTSFGGLLFGMAAAILWAVRRKVSVWAMLDLVAPAFVLGHAIGRIGCLLNGCCGGEVCPQNLSWGVHVEGSSLLHYPAQVYDTLMNLVVLGYLLLRERKGLNLGQLAGLGLSFHGLTRVIYEFWRAGTDQQVQAGEASSTYIRLSEHSYLPFTQAQVMAAVLVVAGAAIYIFFRHGKAVVPTPPAKSEALAA